MFQGLRRGQKLEPRAKKLETALRSARIKKASQVYQILTGAATDEVLFLLYHSTLKPVQERLRNYFQKYLPAIQEITPQEWAAVVDAKPGTSKYNKAREDFIANRLDRRARKPAPPPEPPPPPEPAPAMMGRGRR